MSKVITGESGATLQPVKWNWSPTKGTTLTRSYEGTSETALAALEAELRSGGWEYSVDMTTGKWRVSAGRGGTQFSVGGSIDAIGGGVETVEPLANYWELTARTIEKDLLESDNAYVAGISDDTLSELRDLYNGKKSLTQITIYDSPTAPADHVVRLILAGQKSIRIDQPVLRHTRVVTDKYAIKASRANVGKIFLATKISAEGIPADLKVALPSEESPITNANFTRKYGWFKGSPQILQQGGGQWQIITEYEWGLWPYNTVYTFVA